MSNRRESAEARVQNRNLVVGVTEVAVNPLDFRFVKGLLLRTPGTQDPTPNTAPVWIGQKGVTADITTATGGFTLVPGSSIFLPVEFATNLYAISTLASQYLLWVGV